MSFMDMPKMGSNNKRIWYDLSIPTYFASLEDSSQQPILHSMESQSEDYLSYFHVEQAKINSISSRLKNESSVNVTQLDGLVPHAHSTHTECIAHISKYLFHSPNSFRIDWVSNIPILMRAWRIQLQPIPVRNVYTDGKNLGSFLGWIHDEEFKLPPSYSGSKILDLLINDLVITSKCMESGIAALKCQSENVQPEALILECVWNNKSNSLQHVAANPATNSKSLRPPRPSICIKDYSATNPPYFTPKAMKILVERFPSANHLLVNLPSLEREDSFSLVPSHEIFFRTLDPLFQELEQKQHLFANENPDPSDCISEWEESAYTWLNRSITESCHITSAIGDAQDFCLNLQVPHLVGSDAVPSRPIICKWSNSPNSM
jgi:hypothetical protein